MISDKLTQPRSHLKCDDLTASQKQRLFDFMGNYGANRSFSYNRFFRDGFSEWELRGIDAAKRDFAILHSSRLVELLGKEKIENGDFGYDGAFFRAVCQIRGMKTAFERYMGSLGMCASSVNKKFANDNFKPFEVIGIWNIVKMFECRESSC